MNLFWDKISYANNNNNQIYLFEKILAGQFFITLEFKKRPDKCHSLSPQQGDIKSGLNRKIN